MRKGWIDPSELRLGELFRAEGDLRLCMRVAVPDTLPGYQALVTDGDGAPRTLPLRDIAQVDRLKDRFAITPDFDSEFAMDPGEDMEPGCLMLGRSLWGRTGFAIVVRFDGHRPLAFWVGGEAFEKERGHSRSGVYTDERLYDRWTVTSRA